MTIEEYDVVNEAMENAGEGLCHMRLSGPGMPNALSPSSAEVQAAPRAACYAACLHALRLRPLPTILTRT